MQIGTSNGRWRATICDLGPLPRLQTAKPNTVTIIFTIYIPDSELSLLLFLQSRKRLPSYVHRNQSRDGGYPLYFGMPY